MLFSKNTFQKHPSKGCSVKVYLCEIHLLFVTPSKVLSHPFSDNSECQNVTKQKNFQECRTGGKINFAIISSIAQSLQSQHNMLLIEEWLPHVAENICVQTCSHYDATTVGWDVALNSNFRHLYDAKQRCSKIFIAHIYCNALLITLTLCGSLTCINFIENTVPIQQAGLYSKSTLSWSFWFLKRLSLYLWHCFFIICLLFLIEAYIKWRPHLKASSELDI